MRIPAAAAAAIAAVALLGAPPSAASPLACGALGGAVDNGMCHVHETSAAFVVDMRFPLDYPDEQAIVDYLAQTRQGFLNIAATPDPRSHLLEMDVTAESLESQRTRSVVLTLFQDVGSAHPTTWYKSFTYDTSRGRPVTFETLFAPGADPLTVIFPIVQRELEARSGLATTVSDIDGRDPSHYQNFAVTDESVVFYFGRGELLPSYAGETSVAIPRSALPPLAV